MQFATAAVPVPIDSELYCTEFEEEVVVAASEAVGSIHVDLNSDCRSECSQIPGELPLWLGATAEGEVAVAAAVDGNFQANETTDYFRQIVHHYSFLLLLSLPAE